MVHKVEEESNTYYMTSSCPVLSGHLLVIINIAHSFVGHLAAQLLMAAKFVDNFSHHCLHAALHPFQYCRLNHSAYPLVYQLSSAGVYGLVSAYNYIVVSLLFHCFFYTVSAARTCHCTESQMNCQTDGKCQSHVGEDDFSCLVARRYNRFQGEFVIHQLCILDAIDYGIYCNQPAVGGIVYDVSLLTFIAVRYGWNISAIGHTAERVL